MKRIPVTPRSDYREKIEALGFDFHVRRVMKNYLPNDEESKHCATLLQWDNIYYQEPTQDYVDKMCIRDRS